MARGDEQEEEVGAFGFERDVLDLTDDKQGGTDEAPQLVLGSAGVVGVGESVSPPAILTTGR